MRDLNKKAKKDKTFTFDNVYDHSSTNEQVSTHYTVSVQGAKTSVDGGGVFIAVLYPCFSSQYRLAGQTK